jgi:Family of unknown function (DUF5906)
MPTVVQSIGLFLTAKLATHNCPDLLRRYLDVVERMETQVKVSAGSGWAVDGKTSTYTDGLDDWWNIRIPKKADSEPYWREYTLSWPLDLHAEGIGSTGWDYVNRRSMWVGFDFDELTDHSKGTGAITAAELDRVKEAACALPYVEVRKSTGGKGLHLYVFFDFKKIVTENHTVHAALARTILGMMSTEAGFDFASQLDVCGGNMWVWHRKSTPENGGLRLIKKAEKVLSDDDIPVNWKDNVAVVTRKRAKIRVGGVPEADLDPFEALASSRRIVPLDEKHKAIIDALKASGFSTVWVPDHHLLQTHTCALRKVMDEQKAILNLQGFFRTESKGKNPGEPNCFLFPLDSGGFKVYLFGPGRPEVNTWEQDGQGWTTCYFNRPPGLKIAARANGGIEDEQGGFLFERADAALETAKTLGQKINLPAKMMDREAKVKAHRDGRLIFIVGKRHEDSGMEGWAAKKDKWARVLEVKADVQIKEVGHTAYDNMLRALHASGSAAARWMYRSVGEEWHPLPVDQVKLMLIALGEKESDTKQILGSGLLRWWNQVNEPFKPEYPGGRAWNYQAAQFRYLPAERNDDETVLTHPHWDMILKHCGQDLDVALKDLEWAKQANIRTGADYLLAWAACMFRAPTIPLPYLFFYSPKQNTGKSSYHQALALLMTKGAHSADGALTNEKNFNEELANVVLAYVEETNVGKSANAYNRLKAWVTSPYLTIEGKGHKPYSQRNTLHFVQTANDRAFCPMQVGDERITMFFVPDLTGPEIAWPIMEKRLEAEAPAFMRTLLDLQLPSMIGRLHLPVVSTHNKQAAEEANKSDVELFIEGECFECIGNKLLFADFYEAFRAQLAPEDRGRWNSSQKVRRAIPSKYPFFRGGKNKSYIGNLSLEDKAPAANAEVLVLFNGKPSHSTLSHVA